MYTVPWTRIPEDGTARETGLVLDLESLGLGVPFEPGSLRLSWELSRRLNQAYGFVEVQARIRQTCSRCLAEFAAPVSARCTVLFEPHSSAPYGRRGAGRPQEDSQEDAGGDGVRFAGDLVPLGEEARQEIEMAVPFTPLCRPDCRGLCPRCGVNRNAGVCACAGA